MKYEITSEEAGKAKIPHEIFLTNLIGNHILWFIAALGMAKSYWQPVALVPIVSVVTLMYLLWRARYSRKRDSWYVMCHWQICARRSRMFIYMLLLAALVSLLGWLGYSLLGMMREAVYALVGGLGMLPVMVTVLVLILMESDSLHQAALHRLPDRIAAEFPNPGVLVIEDQ